MIFVTSRPFRENHVFKNKRDNDMLRRFNKEVFDASVPAGNMITSTVPRTIHKSAMLVDSAIG